MKTPDLVSHFSSLAGPQPRLGTNVFTFLMNKASYDKLPADLQKVIDDNSGRNIAKAAGQNWVDVETPGLQGGSVQGEEQVLRHPGSRGCPDEGRRRAGV